MCDNDALGKLGIAGRFTEAFVFIWCFFLLYCNCLLQSFWVMGDLWNGLFKGLNSNHVVFKMSSFKSKRIQIKENSSSYLS